MGFVFQLDSIIIPPVAISTFAMIGVNRHILEPLALLQPLILLQPLTVLYIFIHFRIRRVPKLCYSHHYRLIGKDTSDFSQHLDGACLSSTSHNRTSSSHQYIFNDRSKSPISPTVHRVIRFHRVQIKNNKRWKHCCCCSVSLLRVIWSASSPRLDLNQYLLFRNSRSPRQPIAPQTVGFFVDFVISSKCCLFISGLNLN